MSAPPYAYFSPPITGTSDTTIAILKAGGLTGRVQALAALAANGPKANPTTAPTGVASTASGTLPAGTYFFRATQSDGNGETLPTLESSGVVLSAPGTITVTLNDAAITNGVSRSLYATGGASGTEKLLVANLTSTTYVWSAPAVATQAPAPPTTNMTGLLLSRVFAGRAGNLELEYRSASDLIDAFAAGQSVDLREVIARLGRHAAAFKTIVAAIEECAAAVAANPGTIGTEVIWGKTYVTRTWP